MAKQYDEKLKPIILEDVRIIYRNFAGVPDKKYNPNGNRTFGVILPNIEIADKLSGQGWNVKYIVNEDSDDTPWLKVKVSYKVKKPIIYMISGKKRTLMSEETVGELDSADIIKTDVEISPYPYEIEATGASGIAAYIKTMYVTIAENPFAAKYDFDDEGEELPFE